MSGCSRWPLGANRPISPPPSELPGAGRSRNAAQRRGAPGARHNLGGSRQALRRARLPRSYFRSPRVTCSTTPASGCRRRTGITTSRDRPRVASSRRNSRGGKGIVVWRRESWRPAHTPLGRQPVSTEAVRKLGEIPRVVEQSEIFRDFFASERSLKARKSEQNRSV
jgi:hypothetical protein